MGHSYTHLLVHVIFSTKDRVPLLAPDLRPRLFEYMGGLARGEFGTALEVGGAAEHVHGLLAIRPDIAVAHALGRWKSLSSGWVHQTFPNLAAFAWQIGYGAFSVSPSNAQSVIAYIRGQEEHHRHKSFQEEFIALLQRHGVDYDAAHLWD